MLSAAMHRFVNSARSPHFPLFPANVSPSVSAVVQVIVAEGCKYAVNA